MVGRIATRLGIFLAIFASTSGCFNGELQWSTLGGSNRSANLASPGAANSSGGKFNLEFAPPQAQGGTLLWVKVTALDANDQVLPSFTGDLTFSSSDPVAVFPEDRLMAPADQGRKVFPIIFKTAGTHSLTAQSGGMTGTFLGITISNPSCGPIIEWTGVTNTSWTSASNWSATVPSSSDHAVIWTSAFLPTISTSGTVSCLTLSTGTLNIIAPNVLTVSGSQFRNELNGSLTMGSSAYLTFNGSGSPQVLSNGDTVSNLSLNNATVFSNRSFTLSTALTLSNSTLYLNDSLKAQTAFTIPTGSTIQVNPKATLYAMQGLTVNGSLIVLPGGRVVIENGQTLSVGASGTLKLSGTPGAYASLDGSYSIATYALAVAGTISAEYFTISRTNSSGLNLSGTASSLRYGRFHHIASSGYGLTLSGSASLPASIERVGFFDDHGFGNTKNVNATSYGGPPLTFASWQGLGGPALELDPLSKVSWGTSETLSAILVSSMTPSGSPPSTIVRSSGSTVFHTFAFSLSDPGAANTDITSLTLALNGDAVASDVAQFSLFLDTNGDCAYDGGDSLLAQNHFMNWPPRANVNIAPGVFTLTPGVRKCIHASLTTSNTAYAGRSLGVALTPPPIQNTQNYPVVGLPLFGPLSKITGGAGTGYWLAISTNWNSAGSWSGSLIPNSSTSCYTRVANGIDPFFTGGSTCESAFFPAGSSTNLNGQNLSVMGSLIVGPNSTFINTNTLYLGGTGHQSILAQSMWPGNVQVNNASGKILIDSNWTINGNLFLNTGTNVLIPPGRILTVHGVISGPGTLDNQGQLVNP